MPFLPSTLRLSNLDPMPQVSLLELPLVAMLYAVSRTTCGGEDISI
jgi:hypothetical protein